MRRALPLFLLVLIGVDLSAQWVKYPTPGTPRTRDGKVDMGDYLVWRDSVGENGYLAADGNGDHVVDTLDYNLWRQHFGQTAGSGAGSFTAVPEPATVMTFLIAACCVAISGRRLRAS